MLASHRTAPAPLRRAAAARLVALSVVTLAVFAPPCQAIDWKKRWTLAFRAGDYLPADELGGGFRINSDESLGTVREREVQVGEVPTPTFLVGYGVKSWTRGTAGKQVHLTVELEVSSIDADVGDETGFEDDNASTRVQLPGRSGTGPDGDERNIRFPLASVKLTPVFANALFHWGGARRDFYAGAGLGVIFGKLTEATDYRDFVGDFDSADDVRLEDGTGMTLKAGANVALDKNSRWYLFFEGQYLTTNVLGGGPKIAWPGVQGFFGQRDYDTDADGSPDVFGVPAEFHAVDPGKLRIDGAIVGIGLRYRFGGDRSKAAETATPEAGS